VARRVRKSWRRWKALLIALVLVSLVAPPAAGYWFGTEISKVFPCPQLVLVYSRVRATPLETGEYILISSQVEVEFKHWASFANETWQANLLKKVLRWRIAGTGRTFRSVYYVDVETRKEYYIQRSGLVMSAQSYDVFWLPFEIQVGNKVKIGTYEGVVEGPVAEDIYGHKLFDIDGSPVWCYVVKTGDGFYYYDVNDGKHILRRYVSNVYTINSKGEQVPLLEMDLISYNNVPLQGLFHGLLFSVAVAVVAVVVYVVHSRIDKSHKKRMRALLERARSIQSTLREYYTLGLIDPETFVKKNAVLDEIIGDIEVELGIKKPS